MQQKTNHFEKLIDFGIILQKTEMKRSKYTPVILVYLLFFTAALLAILWIISRINQQSRGEAIRQFQQTQVILAQQAALSLQSFLEERMRALEVLADFPASKKLEVPIFLTEYQRTYYKVGGFESLQFVDTLGNIEVGYPADSVYHSNIFQDEVHFQSSSELFMQALWEKRSFFSPLVRCCGNKKIVYLLTPIFNGEQYRGVILGKIRVVPFVASQVGPILEDYPGYCWILQADGNLVYHPEHQEVGYNALRPAASCQRCHADFEFTRDILRQNRGSGLQQGVKGELITSYTRIHLPTMDWKVVISIPSFFAYGVMAQTSRNLLLLGALVLGSSLLAAVFLSANIVRRIRAENRATELDQEIRHRQEKEQLELRYYSLVENLQDGIFLFQKNRFILLNQAFLSIFQYSEEELLHRENAFARLLPPREWETVRGALYKCLNGKQYVPRLEITARTSGGDERELVLLLSPLKLGEQIAAQGIVRDVTELKKLEVEKRQREHFALMGEMSARIAHEIKNPLASIQMGIQVLRNKMKAGSGECDYCNRILEEIRRMDRTIRSLLTYSKLTELNLAEGDLSEPLQAVLEMLRGSDSDGKYRFEVLKPETLPPVRIDSQAWRQIFWNLLTNATQAMEGGGVVRIAFTPIGEKMLRISIEDEGKGIPPEIQEKIFSPFFSTKVQGTGLGLSITRRLVELHLGSIAAKNRAGGGACFTIQLPTVTKE